MRQVMGFVEGYLGERGAAFIIGLIILFSALAFLIFVFKNHPNIKKNLAIVLFLAIGIILSWQIKMPAERIHILEYGILGWFANRDLTVENKKCRGFIFAWLLIITVGIFDEAFQKILPYRVGDSRDIFFNNLGGLWGIGLWFLKNKLNG